MSRAARFRLPLLLLLAWAAARAWGQGETTSAIQVQVLDATGAAIPGATVGLVDLGTGRMRMAATSTQGRYLFAQLQPGTYAVQASAAGFAPQQNNRVVAGLGQTQSVDFRLAPAQASQTVQVSGAAPLVDARNANTSTSMNARALENLPNPGGDLTYPLQFAPGALMNTAGSSNDFVGSQNGYGNVEFNGLSAIENGYIVDGLETNDPLTNLNSGLSTNLVLGLNSIAEVTVNTLSYSAEQGRYGASQVDYVTKSGTNVFHGNLYETWNGAALNAADFFTNAIPGSQKPNSVVNHFGGSLGGPILHNKLFFFFDSEWVRIALPIVTETTVPSPAFESYVLQQLPLGGNDTVTGAVYPAEPDEVPFYQNMFSLYRNTSGTALAVLGCPLEAGGGTAAGSPPDGNGCANRQNVSQSSDDHEQVQTLRLDADLDSADTAWVRLQSDTGVQAAYTDPINPLFDAVSPQPMYSLATGYTHIFSANLVNSFNPGFSWYESLFAPADFQQTLQAFPVVLEGSGANAPFTTLGGLDNTWTQGRRASRFFINDSLAWSHGRHEFGFGENARILRLNDYDFGEGAIPKVTYATLGQYIYGAASTAAATYPLAKNEPFNFANLDLYAQDTWRLTQTLTWTIGMRGSWNSNPLNPHDQLARLPADFASIDHDVNQPLNAVIGTGLDHIFASTPLAILQPRTALAWQFAPNTVLRAGFGVFSDLLPGSIADLVGNNPPYVNTFEGGLLGTAGGVAIAPGVPGSVVEATASANQSFAQGFAQGWLSCASPQANPGACLLPVAMTAVPGGELRPPYSMQWSLDLERQFGATTAVRAQYVGTASADQPYLTQVNGYQTVCAGCFAPYPYMQPADPRFAAVTQLETGATGNYNGLQLTVTRNLSHGLQGQINYTYSHCLDEVSNGGFLQFSSASILAPLPNELARDYGPCDYDIRHNLSAEYVYQLPFKTSNRSLGRVVNGWQISGTVIFHTGLPFSVYSTPYSANGDGIVQAAGPQFASVVPGVPLYDSNPIPGVTQPGTVQWLNPNAFVSTVDPATGACVGGDSPTTCQFGDLGRNALRGPDFVWSDFYLTKWFQLGESLRLRLEAQCFNLLNHPNFALPSRVQDGVPGEPSTQTGFGALTATTSPPTGLLGVGLGGDSSPRMVALEARIEF